MNLELILILIILVFFIILLILIRKWLADFSQKNKPSEELLAWLKSTNQRLDDQNKNITSTLQASTRALNERLDNAARFISAVQKNIGEMSEIGRGMKDLQEFLRGPKMRGNIGEFILKELLSQIMPKQSFYLQYVFKSGSVVDAAIKTTNGIIPIDSKFPLSNFQRLIKAKNEEEKKSILSEFEKDIKKHIDDISKKYILTDEGTIDYALMYLPSEVIYYEVVNNLTLFEYAAAKKVLPVSPMTLYAYLRAILMSFEGQKIESEAKEILQTIKALQGDYQKVDDNLNILNRHLTNAHNQMSNVYTSFSLLGQKITKTSGFHFAEKKHLRLK